MSADRETDAKSWDAVLDMLGDGRKTLGTHWSFNLLEDPKRLGFVLSRYKFAAKLAGSGRKVLELGCSEGIGAPILAEHATSYMGVDLDKPAVVAARENFARDGVEFETMDFLGERIGSFDSIVSLDVVEHIPLEYEDLLVETIAENLNEDGICVVGTPNVTSDPYASPMSKAGHVNLYDNDRLQATLKRVFNVVMMFGINDEVVHTGFAPMAHYLVAVGCFKR